MILRTGISLLAMYLQDDIDLVTTDVLACLVLLGEEESQLRSKVCAVAPSRDSSRGLPASWMTVPRARHYMRFALAAFGWPMYILPSPQLMQSMWRIYHVSRYTGHHITNKNCCYVLLRPAPFT